MLYKPRLFYTAVNPTDRGHAFHDAFIPTVTREHGVMIQMCIFIYNSIVSMFFVKEWKPRSGLFAAPTIIVLGRICALKCERDKHRRIEILHLIE